MNLAIVNPVRYPNSTREDTRTEPKKIPELDPNRYQSQPQKVPKLNPKRHQEDVTTHGGIATRVGGMDIRADEATIMSG